MIKLKLSEIMHICLEILITFYKHMKIQFVASRNRKLMADPVFAVDGRPG